MRAVVQRVREASVSVGGEPVSSIGVGLLVLLGVSVGDSADESDYLARKIVALRVFEDNNGKMNLAVNDVGGELLVVSQFTLCANTHKGNRPSFVGAARPETAEPLVCRFIDSIRTSGVPCQEGVFGAHMDVALVNDGPVTIVFDTNS